MSKILQVTDMPVYQQFYSLAIRIAKCTREYPSDYRWLRNQSLRSSESVPANMTEGFYSQYSTEYLQCLYRCRREARETMTHIKYAGDVHILPREIVEELNSDYENSLGSLSRLIGSIERKARAYGKAKPNAVKEESPHYGSDSSTINHQPFPINHQPSTISHQP